MVHSPCILQLQPGVNISLIKNGYYNLIFIQLEKIVSYPDDIQRKRDAAARIIQAAYRSYVEERKKRPFVPITPETASHISQRQKRLQYNLPSTDGDIVRWVNNFLSAETSKKTPALRPQFSSNTSATLQKLRDALNAPSKEASLCAYNILCNDEYFLQESLNLLLLNYISEALFAVLIFASAHAYELRRHNKLILEYKRPPKPFNEHFRVYQSSRNDLLVERECTASMGNRAGQFLIENIGGIRGFEPFSVFSSTAEAAILDPEALRNATFIRGKFSREHGQCQIKKGRRGISVPYDDETTQNTGAAHGVFGGPTANYIHDLIHLENMVDTRKPSACFSEWSLLEAHNNFEIYMIKHLAGEAITSYLYYFADVYALKSTNGAFSFHIHEEFYPASNLDEQFLLYGFFIENHCFLSEHMRSIFFQVLSIPISTAAKELQLIDSDPIRKIIFLKKLLGIKCSHNTSIFGVTFASPHMYKVCCLKGEEKMDSLLEEIKKDLSNNIFSQWRYLKLTSKIFKKIPSYSPNHTLFKNGWVQNSMLLLYFSPTALSLHEEKNQAFDFESHEFLSVVLPNPIISRG